MFSALTRRVNFARASALVQTKRDFCVKALYVGNIPWTAQEDDLSKLFSNFGKIDNIHMPRLDDGRLKGFAFVRYIIGERPVDAEEGSIIIPTTEEIQQCDAIIKDAIEKTDGIEFLGRSLRVNIANQNEARSPDNRRPNNGGRFFDRDNSNRRGFSGNSRNDF
ncbi:hypothetical protein BB561_001929 [Smittium simulii]|uniref:RRM domain-containing protein n=1 Tax=Smittium simulii TaxID=133385 RepID=A0A2T9YSD2_9FUNG|nr:hypothetical protein BB561_001929 [Smittium simulii]